MYIKSMETSFLFFFNKKVIGVFKHILEINQINPFTDIQFTNIFFHSLLLLSHFSRVRLCATPSLGFSRQEHWSGLPFPSPMHKSEK